MKKILLIAAFGAFGFMSCTKTYVCECITTDLTETIEGDLEVDEDKITGTKSDAKVKCDKGTIAIGPLSTVCELKQ